MDAAAITRYITETFPGVDLTVAPAGDAFFTYDPDGMRAVERGFFPFATLVTGDHYDTVSQLGRPGVFRLNIGVPKETYRSLLGPQPSPPEAGSVVDTGHDFSALDQILPHPEYAHLSWISVLNPAEATLETVKGLLAEAYADSVRKYRKSHPES